MSFEKNICIFACDHRKNVNWNLPYIRLGSKNSDAILNIANTEFEKYDPCASEGSQIFYIYKNLKEFGQFDYIGFSHYRTFIANVKPNFGVFPMCVVKDEIIDPILTPNQQLELIKKYDLDGILPAAFYDFAYYKNCKNVQDLTYAQSITFKNNLTHTIILNSYDEVKFAYDLLLDNTPNEYKDYMKQSFNILKTYHFNIFTLKHELFELYGKIIFPTCETLYNTISITEYLDKRWLGYLLERLTSCVLLMFILSGKKFIEYPVLQIQKNIL